MPQFSRVPVIDVHTDNWKALWPALLSAVKTSSFIALDCELSGLGDRRKLNLTSAEERYAALSHVAKTRSIISLGLSCFQFYPTSSSSEQSGSKQGHSWTYIVQTFNIWVLCREEYVVEPKTLRFLVEHGFDFQKQYSTGVPYYRGNDKVKECKDHKSPVNSSSASPEDPLSSKTLRDLFSVIVASGKSIVLHNGVVDLIFMYQNFYADLPSSWQSFISDIYDMFRGGIYDTKFISDYVLRCRASYLEYIFRSEQVKNIGKYRKDRPHVKLKFPKYPESCSFVNYRYCGVSEEKKQINQNNVCQSYANHGWCPKEGSCQQSHNIDLVLQVERSRKKRKLEDSSEISKVEQESSFSEKCNGEDVTSKDQTVTDLEEQESGGTQNSQAPSSHRAGFDAFMTAFCFTTFLVHHSKISPCPKLFTTEELGTHGWINKMYLTSKDFPLSIMKSSFCKNSKQHLTKFEKIKELYNL